MSFAAVQTVNLEGRDLAQAEQGLREELVPILKAQPGFQNARFLRSQDGRTGVGAMMFDTESNAKACLDMMASERPEGAPPIIRTEILELVVEAQ